ncbi:MAG: hypothetical protein KatS3mg076_3092 [Candidatus Binatia bacterium]|nr:MAG: hypothetical protein KatS3mg076_3092 [Candidatus Binatia bacterium]
MRSSRKDGEAPGGAKRRSSRPYVVRVRAGGFGDPDLPPGTSLLVDPSSRPRAGDTVLVEASGLPALRRFVRAEDGRILVESGRPGFLPLVFRLDEASLLGVVRELRYRELPTGTDAPILQRLEQCRRTLEQAALRSDEKARLFRRLSEASCLYEWCGRAEHRKLKKALARRAAELLTEVQKALEAA